MGEFYKVVRRIPKLPVLGSAIYHKYYYGLLKDHYIIDIETTGLDERRDVIICFGIADLSKQLATIYFLEEPHKHAKFRKFCKSLVLSIMNSGGKVWSYNTDFEGAFLGIKGLRELSCKYLGCGYLRYGRKDWTYEEFIRYLFKSELIKDEEKELLKKFVVSDEIDGSQVPELYFYDWVIYRKEEAKMKIINHNYYDLVKEAIILFTIFHMIETIKLHLLNEYGRIPEIFLQLFNKYIH